MAHPSRPHDRPPAAPPPAAPAPVSLDEESVAGEEDPGASIDLGLPPAAPAAPATPPASGGSDPDGRAALGTSSGGPI
ncbi:hypothetical protein [Aquabacterium sp. J223]|uniref:hypothetical protein n=1 Tax=Aquabacterium sp. J223 TaxID=2898431 RepID=UPI0021ADA991|nr:hypothetical protein [Aquabacterium sp. J223]UUX95646.1 hypothetical protein LRS07_21010 [Aquabacterium sp. J223]